MQPSMQLDSLFTPVKLVESDMDESVKFVMSLNKQLLTLASEMLFTSARYRMLLSMPSSPTRAWPSVCILMVTWSLGRACGGSIVIETCRNIKIYTEPRHDKNNKVSVRPAKTQIRLGGSDQSLRCPHEETLGPYLPIERTAKTLIRLGRCPGWSESSLGAQSFCWFCHVVTQLSGRKTEEQNKQN